MREIRFRGKCIEDCELKGQWLYGHYLKSASHFIAVDQGLVDGHFKLYQVDPETVGQYTGLKDRNGREIYEGDILRDEFDRIFRVYWVNGEARFAIRQKKRKTEYFMFISHIHPVVIGNIHDNPELLKGDENA